MTAIKTKISTASIRFCVKVLSNIRINFIYPTDLMEVNPKTDIFAAENRLTNFHL